MPIYRGQPADGLSMSASDAIKLAESTPLHLRQSWLETPKRERRANIGTAIHALLLEEFRKHTIIRRIDAADYRTKAAQEAADEALAAGLVPMLPDQLDEAMAAVDAVRSHREAGRLFDSGKAEQCYFSRHQSGVW